MLRNRRDRAVVAGNSRQTPAMQLLCAPLFAVAGLHENHVSNHPAQTSHAARKCGSEAAIIYRMRGLRGLLGEI
jgi:hypothetical protein